MEPVKVTLNFESDDDVRHFIACTEKSAAGMGYLIYSDVVNTFTKEAAGRQQVILTSLADQLRIHLGLK